MFDKKFLTNALNRSAETQADRRKFLVAAGAAGLTATAAAVAGGAAPASAAGPSDATILNFALNLEYLEAEFYLRAVNGTGLPDSLTTGQGARGGVTGGRQVTFATPAIRSYAVEIAADERAHVAFLRAALGSARVSRPAINLQESFTAAAVAAGVIQQGQTFDPFADEVSFLLGAFIFEDLGVTAYKGAAPLISNATFLDAAAGLLAVEAYHAGIIRSVLYRLGLDVPSAGIFGTVDRISNARDSLDGASDLDQGIGDATTANLVPTDRNALTFSRTPGQVLNVAYLNNRAVGSGGFYPAGVNGALNQSAAN